MNRGRKLSWKRLLIGVGVAILILLTVADFWCDFCTIKKIIEFLPETGKVKITGGR